MKTRPLVVIDGRWIIPQPSGIGIYTREMVARIPKILPDFDFRILFRSSELQDDVCSKAGISESPNVSGIIVPYGPFAPKGQILLPLMLRRLECSLFHTTNYAMPYFAFPRGGRGRIKSIAVIHDVIPLIVRDYAPNSKTSRMMPLYRECLRQTMSRADKVVTVSESSKKDIVKTLSLDGKSEDKIIAVHNGVSGSFKPSGNKRIPDESSERVLLYVGRLDPYKNVPALVKAFAESRKRLPFPVRLRIIGPADSRYPESRIAAEKLGVADSVDFQGFLSGDELADEYRNADLLVHPSGYEGFGLQIIEAMKSGLPVICSDGGAQKEVAGDAAVLVTPGDIGETATAIVNLLSDPAAEDSLRKKGLARAEHFSWDAAAGAVAAIYRNLLA